MNGRKPVVKANSLIGRAVRLFAPVGGGKWLPRDEP
mgnify:CR=1 FL=1